MIKILNQVVLDGLSYKYLLEENLQDKGRNLEEKIYKEKKEIVQTNSDKNLKKRKLILASNSPIKRLIVYSNTTRILIKRSKNLKKQIK